MSRLQITFGIDNDIFHENLPAEVSRILTNVVTYLDQIADDGIMALVDINGNTVGDARLLTRDDPPTTINPSSDEDKHLAWDCMMAGTREGDWWTCRFFHLLHTSDEIHLAQLATAYPREVAMYREWRTMTREAFDAKWLAGTLTNARS